MKTKTIESWEELASIAYDHRDKGWIYRGVDDKEWKLIPKVGRSKARISKLEYDRDAEMENIARFKRAARPILNILPDKDLDWLALAQHHGVPTRLLDWTFSPLVAAYFAVKPGSTNGPDRAVYGCPPPEKLSDSDRSDPFNLTWTAEAKLLLPQHTSPRITVQRAVFTLHKIPTRAYQPSTLVRWVIPAKQTLVFKKALDVCGINEATLFPDLDGIGGYIGWQYWRGR